jgi:hypothetical protein
MMGIAAAMLSLMVMLGNLIPLFKNISTPKNFPIKQLVQAIGSACFLYAIVASQLYTANFIDLNWMLGMTISGVMVGLVLSFIPAAFKTPATLPAPTESNVFAKTGAAQREGSSLPAPTNNPTVTLGKT